MFRRSRFSKLVQTQLDVFVRDHQDVLDEIDARLQAYNAADRDDAEELYGDYVDAVDTGTEILADMRDHYARSVDEPDEYLSTFNRAAARRLPDLAARIEEA